MNSQTGENVSDSRCLRVDPLFFVQTRGNDFIAIKMTGTTQNVTWQIS